MPPILAAIFLVLVVGMVLVRVFLLKKQGVQAMHFGKTDKKDLLIPPFALFYFYTVFAHAFGFPSLVRGQLFDSQAAAWAGILLGSAGLLLFAASLISFGRSFRVGIDLDHPDRLVTTGVFSLSRNPIYAAFGSVLLGEFLVFPNWVLLAYCAAMAWLVHRQVLREEEFLKQHYGREYSEYCRRVRRYL